MTLECLSCDIFPIYVPEIQLTKKIVKYGLGVFDVWLDRKQITELI